MKTEMKVLVLVLTFASVFLEAEHAVDVRPLDENTVKKTPYEGAVISDGLDTKTLVFEGDFAQSLYEGLSEIGAKEQPGLSNSITTTKFKQSNNLRCEEVVKTRGMSSTIRYNCSLSHDILIGFFTGKEAHLIWSSLKEPRVQDVGVEGSANFKKESQYITCGQNIRSNFVGRPSRVPVAIIYKCSIRKLD